MDRVGIGIVGLGNISGAYLKATRDFFPVLDIRAIADINPEAARARADEFGLRAVPLDELFTDPGVEIVLNLTIPRAHVEVGLRAVEAGKHVYSEKPLGVSMVEAEELMSIARAGDLRLGCAPDTFLGGGHQLTRRLLDEGRIGETISATAMLLLPGHEHWHPNPAFFYGRGGGPMLDVGPYYVTNLIALLGPVREVFGTAKITRIERTVKTDPHRGETIKVLVPTHLTGVMEFHSGATVTIATSFDVIKHKHNQIELYGSEGTMVTPDPNNFTGKVELFRDGAEAWEEIPVDHPYTEGVPGHLGLRGLGAAEMVDSLRSGRQHRVSSELAFHALEVMTAFERSSQSRGVVAIHSSCGRPDPISPAIKEGRFA